LDVKKEFDCETCKADLALVGNAVISKPGLKFLVEKLKGNLGSVAGPVIQAVHVGYRCCITS
jgi:hypothetical protein